MVANTLLEIYTLIFGWNMYEAIWDLLTGTGIALLPFVSAVIFNFRDNYEEGNAKSAIKGLEIKLFSMILVMALCVIPFPISTTLSSVKYDLSVPDCALASLPPVEVSGTGGSTGTAVDSAFSGMSGLSMNMPVAWTVVSTGSAAITHSAIKSMTCVNNYEFMLMRIGQVTFHDEVLKDRIREFNNVCYKKAAERFKLNPILLPTNISETYDIDWMGSRTLLNAVNEYYEHEESYMLDQGKYGFSRQETLRASDKSIPTGANPYCDEIWLGEEHGGTAKGLRQLILKDIHDNDDDAGDIIDDWEAWGFELITNGSMTTEMKQDTLIKMVLEAQGANLDAKSKITMGNGMDVATGFFDELADEISAVTGFFTSINEFLAANTVKLMLSIAGPMVLAMIQMIIILAAPFVMLLSKYEIKGFLSLAITYFSLEFVNAIWAIGYWFDQRIMKLYMADVGGLDALTNSFLVMTISASSLILLPMIWMGIMGYAGTGMLRSVGGGIGGGAAAGGTLRTNTGTMAMKKMNKSKKK